MQPVYLMLTITKRSDSKEFVNFFLERKAFPIYCTFCNGTTNSETLNLLGIEQNEKFLIQNIVTKQKMDELTDALTHRMNIDLPDRGISVAVPLSSFASRKMLDYIFEGQNAASPEDIGQGKSDEKNSNERNPEMELIISIFCKGNTDNIMKLAREAGATGGTIIHAKGTLSADTDVFFGMTISDEKEILYIVAKKEIKNEIMKAISAYSDESGAHPMVFSLPVSAAAGFRLAD